MATSNNTKFFGDYYTLLFALFKMLGTDIDKGLSLSCSNLIFLGT